MLNPVKSSRDKPRNKFFLTTPQFLKVVHYIHDAILYSGKGIGVSNELASLEPFMGKHTLDGYIRIFLQEVQNTAVSSKVMKNLQEEVFKTYQEPLETFTTYFTNYLNHNIEEKQDHIVILPEEKHEEKEEAKQMVDSDGDTNMSDGEEVLNMKPKSKPGDQNHTINETYCIYLDICSSKHVNAKPLESFKQKKLTDTIEKIQDEINMIIDLKMREESPIISSNIKPEIHQEEKRNQHETPEFKISGLDQVYEKHPDKANESYDGMSIYSDVISITDPTSLNYKLNTVFKEEPKPIASKQDIKLIQQVIDHNHEHPTTIEEQALWYDPELEIQEALKWETSSNPSQISLEITQPEELKIKKPERIPQEPYVAKVDEVHWVLFSEHMNFDVEKYYRQLLLSIGQKIPSQTNRKKYVEIPLDVVRHIGTYVTGNSKLQTYEEVHRFNENFINFIIPRLVIECIVVQGMWTRDKNLVQEDGKSENTNYVTFCMLTKHIDTLHDMRKRRMQYGHKKTNIEDFKSNKNKHYYRVMFTALELWKGMIDKDLKIANHIKESMEKLYSKYEINQELHRLSSQRPIEWSGSRWNRKFYSYPYTTVHSAFMDLFLVKLPNHDKVLQQGLAMGLQFQNTDVDRAIQTKPFIWSDLAKHYVDNRTYACYFQVWSNLSGIGSKSTVDSIVTFAYGVQKQTNTMVNHINEELASKERLRKLIQAQASPLGIKPDEKKKDDDPEPPKIIVLSDIESEESLPPTPKPEQTQLHEEEEEEEFNPFDNLSSYDHDPIVLQTCTVPEITMNDIVEERKRSRTLHERLGKPPKSNTWRNYPVQPFGTQKAWCIVEPEKDLYEQYYDWCINNRWCFKFKSDFKSDQEIQEEWDQAQNIIEPIYDGDIIMKEKENYKPINIPNVNSSKHKSTRKYIDPYERQRGTIPKFDFSKHILKDDSPIISSHDYNSNDNTRVMVSKNQTIQYNNYIQDPESGDYILDLHEKKPRGRPSLPPEQHKYQKKYSRRGRPYKHTTLSIITEMNQEARRPKYTMNQTDELNDTIDVTPVSPPNHPSYHRYNNRSRYNYKYKYNGSSSSFNLGLVGGMNRDNRDPDKNKKPDWNKIHSAAQKYHAKRLAKIARRKKANAARAPRVPLSRINNAPPGEPYIPPLENVPHPPGYQNYARFYPGHLPPPSARVQEWIERVALQMPQAIGRQGPSYLPPPRARVPIGVPLLIPPPPPIPQVLIPHVNNPQLQAAIDRSNRYSSIAIPRERSVSLGSQAFRGFSPLPPTFNLNEEMKLEEIQRELDAFANGDVKEEEVDPAIVDLYNSIFRRHPPRLTQEQKDEDTKRDIEIIQRVIDNIKASKIDIKINVSDVNRMHTVINSNRRFSYTDIQFDWNDRYLPNDVMGSYLGMFRYQTNGILQNFMEEILARGRVTHWRMFVVFIKDGEYCRKFTKFYQNFDDCYREMCEKINEIDEHYPDEEIEMENYHVNAICEPDDLTGGITQQKIKERLDRIRSDWLIVNPNSHTNCLWTAIAIADGFEFNPKLLWVWKVQNKAGYRLKSRVGTRNWRAGCDEDLQKCSNWKGKHIEVYNDFMEIQAIFSPTNLDENVDPDTLSSLQLMLLRGHYHAMLPRTSPVVATFHETLPMIKKRKCKAIEPIREDIEFANRRIVVYDLESWRNPQEKLVALPHGEVRIDEEIHQTAYACGWSFEIYKDEEEKSGYSKRDLDYATQHDYKMIEVELLGEMKKFAFKQILGEDCLTESLKEWMNHGIFHGAVFYAHNGGKFDIRLFLGQSNLMHSDMYNIVGDKIIELNGRIINMNIENVGIEYPGYNNHKIRHYISLRDDLPLFGMGPGSSLDKLGKDLNTPHKKLAEKVGIHEQMFENTWQRIWEEEKMDQYFENDVMCLIEVLYMFNDVCMKQTGIPITAINTGASLAKKYYLKHFYDCYFPGTKDYEPTRTIYTLSPDMDLFIRDSYGGGRCEAFVSKEVTEPLYYYDFTSLYPDVARNELPLGLPTWMFEPEKIPTPDQTEEYQTYRQRVEAKWNGRIKNKELFGKMLFWKVKVISPKAKIGMSMDPLHRKPLFGVKENGMYLFRWFEEWTEMTLFEPEIIYAMEQGLDYEFYPINAILFHHSPCLKSCMETLFVKKAQAKEQGHEALEKTWKIIINSLYGVWGLKVLDREGIEISRPEKSNWCIDLVTEKLIDIEKIGYYLVTRRSKDLSVKDCNVAIASAITSYARMKLYDLFMDIQNHGGTLLYCDTDSVITNLCIEEHLDMKNKWIGETDGKALGSLKNEIVECIEKYNKNHPDQPLPMTYGFDKGIIVAPKIYMVANEDCKISKKAHKGYKENKDKGDVVTYERLRTLVDKTIEEEDRFMVQQTIQWLGNNGDIVRNNIGVRLVERTKYMYQTVNKGILMDNGDIIPHQVKPSK
jgi:hypothetical protein